MYEHLYHLSSVRSRQVRNYVDVVKSIEMIDADHLFKPAV